MEGGKIKDFIESFSYQSVAVIFKSQKYFSDGISQNENGKYTFYIDLWDNEGNSKETVYEFTGDSISECIEAFENAPIWDGKSFYQAEQEIEWIDW